MKNWIYLLMLICFSACQESGPSETNTDAKPKSVEKAIEAIGLLGDTLYAATEPSKKALSNYEAAKKVYEANPSDAEALIWYGRRTAYLGKYKDAIKIYTEAIEKHPTDARMYRHRGHRYISTRQYKKAIADFEQAVKLIEGKADEVEPDGIPNAQNTPISSLHGNIWYHLALAYYLDQDLDKAEKAYRSRYATHQNDDNIVSASHWYYMTLRRLGKKEEAEKILEPIQEEMNIIENFVYHDMCLFYKGLISEEELLAKNPNNEVYFYGLGNWYLYEKEDQAKAKVYFEKVRATKTLASFAFLAAESDYKALF